MEIASFQDTAKELDQLDEWLKSLGIAPKRDRWHQATGMVQRAQQQRETVESGGSRKPIDNYVDGLFEAMETYQVMRAFRGDTSEALKKKVKRAIYGPFSPLDEQPKNSSARNTMFELSLAAD